MLIQGYAFGETDGDGSVTKPDLSEMQLVDCSKADGKGCSTGDFTGKGLSYVTANTLTTDDQYPYNLASEGTCKAAEDLAAAGPGDKVTLTNYREVATRSASALMQARAGME